MERKKILIVTVVVSVLLICVGVFWYFSGRNSKGSGSTEATTGDNSSTTIVVANAEYDYDDLDDSWDSSVATSINLDDYDGVVSITQSGLYYIKGTLSDGSIVVNVDDQKDVRLVLDGVSITSSTTAPINIQSADKVIITLADGSTNYLTDSASMKVDSSGEPDATLFSKEDLTINGGGKLVVTANYGDGIVSKDTLKIISGDITVVSVDDGIRGTDEVIIKGGNFAITSKGDGIKSTNSTESDKGNVVIEGGTFKIVSSLDGIQAEKSLSITGGTFDITSGSGSSSVSSESMKGLKSGDTISVTGGSFVIVSTDDAVHSNNAVVLGGGTFVISSSDDGIHADSSIIITGGNFDIKKSFEGIESANIEISNATIKVVASDDGINVAGGNDQSAMNGRVGQNSFSSNSNQYLTIDSGSVYISAVGDGIDVNGNVYMNGGTVYVDGPTNDGNGALDFDGGFKITGGTFVAVGSSGMLMTPSSTSTQYSLSVVFNSVQSANSTVVVKNSGSGEEVVSYTASKSFSSVVVSSPSIQKGQSYDVYVNGSKVATLTVSNVVTSYGSGGMQQMGGGRMR